MITADCGGSNSYRCRLWQLKLQELATEIGRIIYVSHLNWSWFVETVEIDIATVLINNLESNQVAFENGIKAINENIQEINDTVGFLRLLERGVNILEKIVNLTIKNILFE